MKRKFSIWIVLHISVYLLFYINGCTFICLGVGSIIEKPDAVLIKEWELESIKPGANIIITLDDGTLVSGKYEGLYTIPFKEYSEKYAEIQEQMSREIVLPSLGDTIIIALRSGKQFEYELQGFDYGCILLKIIEFNETSELDPNFIITIMDSHGNVIKGETLKHLISEGVIPSLSSIIINDGMRKLIVPFYDVNLIRIYDVNLIRKKTNKPNLIKYLLIGVTLDTIIIFTVYNVVKKISKSIY